MKMHKKKKFKYFKQILIPSLSVATAASFAIPLACIFSQKHVTMDYEGQRWATIKTPNQDWFEYHFNLVQPLEEGQTITISTVECPFSEKRASCLATLKDSYQIINPNEISIKIYLVRKDQAIQLVKYDTAFFDIKFTLNNESHKSLWSDEIRSLRLRYEP